MAKTANELLAQYKLNVASVSLGDVLRAMQDQDAKLDQVMATHAANFEERAKEIAKHASMNLGVIEGNVTRRCDGLEKRIHELEHPGKTDNNMRQP